MLNGAANLDLVATLTDRFPAVRVLVISGLDERTYAQRSLAAGAQGFIMKSEATECIVDAIREVLSDHVWVSPRMERRILDGLSGSKASLAPDPVENLSDRELQVFQMLGNSLRTREIAQRLHLSVKTVETYCERLKLHLGQPTYRDLVHHAVLWVHTHGQKDEGKR
jgi:DNA-binding NarL/FixJ family response regulator